jgi:hypothetical protein
VVCTCEKVQIASLSRVADARGQSDETAAAAAGSACGWVGGWVAWMGEKGEWGGCEKKTNQAINSENQEAQ